MCVTLGQCHFSFTAIRAVRDFCKVSSYLFHQTHTKYDKCEGLSDYLHIEFLTSHVNMSVQLY